MPEPRTQAQQDADDATEFFDRLRAKGMDERIAAQLTSAYLLGQMRRRDEVPDLPEWER